MTICLVLTTMTRKSRFMQGILDVDVLASYLTQQSSAAAPLDPSPGRRIDGDGCK